MSHVHILKQLHEECINHGNHMLDILSRISPAEYAELLKNFSYDIEHLFVKTTIEYKVRESEDRLYVIDSICNEQSAPTQECEHNIITDLFDIDPDRSVTIRYCTKCEETFR